jgi:hypothetical protein
MPTYTIRISTDQRHFVMEVSVDCETDLDAISTAHTMLAPGDVANVRQGDRTVCEVDYVPVGENQSLDAGATYEDGKASAHQRTS